jgi:hypothetical protein
MEPRQPKPAEEPKTDETPKKAEELGGRKQELDPTRYGDWEINGKCVDF